MLIGMRKKRKPISRKVRDELVNGIALRYARLEGKRRQELLYEAEKDTGDTTGNTFIRKLRSKAFIRRGDICRQKPAGATIWEGRRDGGGMTYAMIGSCLSAHI